MCACTLPMIDFHHIHFHFHRGHKSYYGINEYVFTCKQIRIMKCFSGEGQNVAYFKNCIFCNKFRSYNMKNKMCSRMVLTFSIDDLYAINNILLRKHFSFDYVHKTPLRNAKTTFTKDTSTTLRSNNTDGQRVRNTFGDS